VGLGSKDAATRFPGRERSMSRSRHRAGSVGAGCSASGVAIAAARWVWLAFELSEDGRRGIKEQRAANLAMGAAEGRRGRTAKPQGLGVDGRDN